jgi:predicted nucleic-acid-binding Zn-ribbon protein
MKSGVCPKCKSQNVHDGSTVPFKRGASSQYAIKISFASAATLDRYVCVDCGYVEGYVNDRPKLERISKEWPRVHPGGYE